MFDRMHHRLHGIAIDERHPGENVSTTPRKEYTLDAVPKSGGGLNDDVSGPELPYQHILRVCTHVRFSLSLSKSALPNVPKRIEQDRELLGRLYYDASSVFEFGLGESTMIAAHVGVPRYSGVDSDAVWVQKAREQSGADRFHFTFADIGPTKAWGTPVRITTSKIPFSYQSSPLFVETLPFDVYLVDGRYRVACFCSSVLHAIGRGADMSKTVFGIHDWERAEYRVVLEVGDLVRKSRKLAVLRVKPNATESDVLRIWEDHIWDQR